MENDSDANRLSNSAMAAINNMYNSAARAHRIQIISVAASVILAVTGILAFVFSIIYYNKQLDEMALATQLEWRPYLNVSVIDVGSSFSWLLGEDEKSDTIPYPLEKVSVTGTEFMAARSFGYFLSAKIKYNNIGKSPLRMTKAYVDCITMDEWKNKYFSSEDILLKKLIKPNLESYDTDIVIAAGEGIEPDKFKGKSRRTTKAEIMKHINNNEKLVFYIIIYFEYQDYFGHDYNTLLINYIIFDSCIKNDCVNMPNIVTRGIERYRWDL